MPAKSILKCRNPIRDLARKSLAAAARLAWPILPRGLYQGMSIQSLNVALTRLCNINCIFCPYQFAPKDELTHMPDDIFNRVIDGIKEAGIRVVMLSPDLGEPPLAPDFMRKVRDFRSAGVKLIQLTTNGTYLHKVPMEEWISPAAPDMINISFPGFDREMYERVCRSPLYDQTRANILEILRANGKAGRPKIINLRLRGDLPEEQLLGFPEMEEVVLLAHDVTVFTGVDDWIGRITQDMLSGTLRIQKERPSLTRRPCTVMFNLTVHPDGSLHLCSCRNIFHDPDLEVGNIEGMSIRQGYQAIFDMMRRWEKGRIPKICKSCSMYGDPAEAVAGRFRRIVERRVFGRYRF